MADTNKVRFGLSNLHIGTYTETGGKVTLGTPVAQPGAIALSLDAEGDEQTRYADDIKYWSNYQDNGMTGDLEVVKFDDAVKEQFLGYRKFKGGGLVSVKGTQKPAVYIAFETKGDKHNRRGILYNVSLGSIAEELSTIEDSIETTTEKVSISVNGDNATGITIASFSPGDSAYTSLFTAPPVPAFDSTLS